MPKGVTIVHWSPEHAAVVAEWIKKYPRGKTINLKQIEFAEPEKWKEILDAGHPPSAMRDKARHILVGRSPSKKPSPTQTESTRAIRFDDGRYQCKTCGEILINKQALSGHYRFSCPGPKPITQPTQTKTNGASWKFCPNCAYPLKH